MDFAADGDGPPTQGMKDLAEELEKELSEARRRVPEGQDGRRRAGEPIGAETEGAYDLDTRAAQVIGPNRCPGPAAGATDGMDTRCPPTRTHPSSRPPPRSSAPAGWKSSGPGTGRTRSTTSRRRSGCARTWRPATGSGPSPMPRGGTSRGPSADLDQAIRLKPDDVQALFDRGQFFLQQRQYDEALTDCNKAVEPGPGAGRRGRPARPGARGPRGERPGRRRLLQGHRPRPGRGGRAT